MSDLLDSPIIWQHFLSMMLVLEEDRRRGPYMDIRNLLLLQNAQRFCRALKIPWHSAMARLDTYVLDPHDSLQ